VPEPTIDDSSGHLRIVRSV